MRFFENANLTRLTEKRENCQNSTGWYAGERAVRTVVVTGGLTAASSMLSPIANYFFVPAIACATEQVNAFIQKEELSAIDAEIKEERNSSFCTIL